MNEELLYVESDEEITAIIDRLHTSKAKAVRLVVPKGALVLQSLVSLKLLKREADKIHKDIALVSQDPIALHLGEQADISVFGKPKDDEPIFSSRGTTPPIQTYRQEPIREDEESETEPDEDDTSGSDDESAPVATADGPIRVHHYEEEVESALPRPDPAERDERADGDDEDAATPLAVFARPPDGKPLKVDHLLAPRRRSFGRLVKRVGIAAIVLALIAATSYILFIEFAPRATVAIAFATQPLDQTVNVTAATAAQSVDTDKATIPAQTVDAPVESQKSAPATGKKDVGTKATTTLNLFNYWDATPQVFPAGTQFKASDGTLFASTADATIPGAQTILTQGQVVTTPGKTTVAIAALTNGPDANGKSGTFTIPSIAAVRQSKIYGESTSATAGGVSKIVTVVSQSDVDSLKKTMDDALKAEAKTQLEQKAPGLRVLDEGIEFKDRSDQFSAAVGDQTDTLNLDTKATAAGLAFRDTDLNQAAIAQLKQAVPSARMLVLSDSDTVTVAGEKLDLSAGTLVISAHYVTRTALIVDTGSLVDEITGQSVAAATQTLKGGAEVASVTVTTRPSWLKTMPRRASQVKLVISYQ